MATQYPEDNRHETDNLQRQIDELVKRNTELTVDLMRKSAEASEASETVRRWRTELELLADQKGHNLCWAGVPRLLKATLGHTGKYPDPERVTKEEFKLGCQVYQDDIFGPDKSLSYSGGIFNRKAVFLDRDGTLIKEVHRPDFHKKITAPFREEELAFVPGVNQALALLKQAGFLRIMITNQPDVANGYMTEEQWQRIHRTVIETLDLDDFHMCRHATDSGCTYHKPNPSMLFSMADKWGIDLSRSFMVGDMNADMKAGKLAGCQTILINKLYNLNVENDMGAVDLLMAARLAISNQRV